MAKRRWRKAMKWTLRLLGVALVGAVGAGWYVYDYPRVAADLPEAVLAYRNAGLPWTAKDLAPNPPVKPEENAAPLLRAAIDAWPQHLVKDAWKRSVDEPDDALDEAVRYGEPTAPLLFPLRRSLSLAHEAAKRPRLDLARDWDLADDLRFTDLARFKKLAQALAVRAEDRATSGDDSGALTDLQDARSVGRLIGQEPSIVSVPTGVGCEVLTMQSARACLAQAANDPRRLSVYRRWLEEPAALFDLRWALRGEAYNRVASVRNFEREGIGTYWNAFTYHTAPFYDQIDEGPRIEPERIRRDGLPNFQRNRAYMAITLRFWTARSRDRQGPYVPSRMQEPPSWEADYSTPVDPAFAWSHWLDGVLCPELASFGTINHRVTAQRALTLAYADALIEHTHTGRWPASCPVPDPLGDGTLGVRMDGLRFRIWSVGPDGADDHGLAREEMKDFSRSSGDLAAAYPPISKSHEKRPPPHQ